jgi:hypothetical protein
MNLPDGFQARVHQLAIGFEPVDALLGQRTVRPVRIDVESPEGVPHPPNRGFAHIAAAADVVPGVGRGEYGTHRMLYLKRHPMPAQTLLRIHDEKRQYVPRRFQLPIPARTEPNAEQRPLPSRKQTPMMFPGAAYSIQERSTGLRGRVLRNGDPMRWAWIDAFLLVNVGTNANPQFLRRGRIGRAISDDRGEFLLVLQPFPMSVTGVADLTDPVWVNVVVNGPSPVPGPANPNDPLWDVPIEILPSAGDPDPATDDNYVPGGYAADTSAQGNRNIPFRLGKLLTGSEVEDFICNLP